MFALFAVDFGLENADEREISVFLIVVKAKSDYEFVGNDLSAVVGCEVDRASFGLIKKRAGTNACRTALLEVAYEVRKGISAVDYILNEI